MLNSAIISVKVSIVLFLITTAFARWVHPSFAGWYRDRVRWMLIWIYVIGMFSPSIWLVFLALTAVLPLLSRDRAEGAALYVILTASMTDLPFNLRIGGASILSIDKWVCLSIGFLIVFTRFGFVGFKTLKRNDLAFWCQGILQFVQIRSMNLTSTIRELIGTTLSYPAPYFMMSRSIGTMTHLRRVMLAFTFTGFLLAAVGIWESLSHFFVYRAVNDHLGVLGAGGLYKFRSGFLRTMTIFSDSITYALFLSVSLMAALACRDMFKKTYHTLLVGGVIFAGIFFTGSRNGFIALTISVICYDLYRRKYAAMFGKLAILAMVYLLAELLAQFLPYVATMMGKTQDTAGTGEYRNLLLQRGMQEFWLHPWMGLNSAEFTANLRDLTQGEGIVDFVNAYLYYALLAGFLGPILLLFLFLLPCILLWKVRSKLERTGPTMVRFAAFVFSSCISLAVSVAFTSYGSKSGTFYLVILAIAANLHAFSRISPDMILESDKARATPEPRLS